MAARDGELRGLAVHVEIFMPTGASGADDVPPAAAASGAGAAEPAAADISSARAGSHWPNVFLMLPDPVAVRAGCNHRMKASMNARAAA